MVAHPWKCVSVAKNGGGRQIKGDGARPWPPLALDSILLVAVTHFLYLVKTLCEKYRLSGGARSMVRAHPQHGILLKKNKEILCKSIKSIEIK